MRSKKDAYIIIYEKNSVAGVISASGDTTLIAAPEAGSEIFIKEFQFQSEAAAEIVVVVRKGASIWRRFIFTSKGDGAAALYSGDDGGIKIGDNVAFIVNLSIADSINYYLDYEIRAI